MPSDRQRRRAVLLATGIVCSTISTGCLTSSFVRRAADPAAEPHFLANEAAGEQRDAQNRTRPGLTDSSVRNASVQAADAPLAGASLATPFLTAPGPSSPTPAGAFPLELQAVPTESTGKAAPSGAPAPATEPLALPSTPLLDAAIQRVADVTRQQREAIASSPTPDSTEDRKATQPTKTLTQPRLSAGPPAPSLTPIAVTAPKPDAAKPPAHPEAAQANLNRVSPLVPEAKEHRAPATTEVRASDPALADELASTVVVEPPNPVHRSPLGISELRLCRKVFGFGSFEALADARVKAGQHLLVYCELTGLQYEVRDAGFVSRISSRVEVKPAQGGPVLWERELGDAEDVCRRRRRDFYVNYRVDLPKSLGPGSYRLRLLQTDLVAGCSTSTDIPLEITP